MGFFKRKCCYKIPFADEEPGETRTAWHGTEWEVEGEIKSGAELDRDKVSLRFRGH